MALVLTKQRILLLVVLLFGVPAVVTLVLLRSSTVVVVADGSQPGGVVRGEVRNEGGEPLADVEVVASQWAKSAIGKTLASTRSGAGGVFELTLPPVQGRYDLCFRGSELQELHVEYGWLGRDGQTVVREPLQVALSAGCRLDVEIVRADKRPAGAGSFELTGVPGGGFFSNWANANLVRKGSFENGAFTIDGLPPMHARIVVWLESGDRVDAVLQLVAGKNRHKVEL